MDRHRGIGGAPVGRTIVMLLLVVVAACGGNRSADEVQTLRGALVPDETMPIGQKWRQLINKGLPIGEATAFAQTVPGSTASYQPFVNGVIVYSNDHGAVYITQAIFNRWQALTSTFDLGGAPVYGSFGLPTADYLAAAAHDEATFTGGMIIVQGGLARVIYGPTYLKYIANRTVLGLPTAEETTTPVFTDARYQTFSGGNIYWRLNKEGPFLVRTEILTEFGLRGGLAATGMPISDTAVVAAPDGTPRGLQSRFLNISFYLNSATGNVFNVDNALATEYERQGGPNGWLGFPKTASLFTSTSSFRYNDFENGVLVWYETTFNPYSTKVAAFGDMQFYLERVTAHGDDCSTCGKQDLFYFVDVSSPSEGVVLVNHERHPSGNGDLGSDTDNFHGGMGPILVGADHATTFTATIEVHDNDLTNTDYLGTVTGTFNIDNLWGKLPGAYAPWVGDAEADFTIKSSHAFRENDFRGQKYWSFPNFSTDRLSYSSFADTFEDVQPQEDAFFNPFNRFYFDNFYESVAQNGNCSGMNLEQIHASRGESRAGMPIHDATINTQNPIAASNSPGLYRDINLRQGAQLGFDVLAWRAKQWITGNTTDFGAVFNDSLAFFNAGDPPMLAIYDDFLYGNAHSLLPYFFDPSYRPCVHLAASQCARIYVADPNFPALSSEVVNADGTRATDRFVEISISGQEYYYDGGNGVIYQGGPFFGARMLVEPAHTLLGEQVTPFYGPYLVAAGAFVMIVGQSGSTQQITDASGRTFFEPGLGGVATRWDQIRQDPAMRVPNIAPGPSTNGSANSAQLWYGQGSGATHTYDLAVKPGVTPGTFVEAAFNAGTMSSRFMFPSTAGKPDKVIAHDINTSTRAISFAVPADSVAKSITWTVAGAEKQRWMEFGALGMSPAQAIKMQSANGGRKLLIDNNGPTTSAHLRAKGGPGGAIVDLGTVTIPSGSSTVELQGPKTTLTTTGVVNGNNGWLVAPVTVTLTTQDRGGYGIEATEYSTDGVSWTLYTAPFVHSTEGITTLYYRARDKEGNVEPSNSHVLKIDSRLPATTGSVTTAGGVKLTYAVTDPTPGSGVAGLHVVQGTSNTVSSFLTPASGTVSLSGTCSAVEFWGEDVAGNMSTPHIQFADTVPPVFTVSPPTTINTTLCTAAAGLNLGSPTATDDCGAVTPTNDAPAKFPLGTTIVTWTARDAAGNITTKTTTVFADLGDDVSCCPTGTTVVLGTSNNDTLTGTSGAECILGLGGQDTIRGNGGNDAISGGEGNDDLWGGGGTDWVAGGAGQDTLHGEFGNDTLSGGDGDDQLWGGANDDHLMGGQGQDDMRGESGNDTLEGGVGDDAMDGGLGNDFLRGGADHDTLSGGGGSDQCVQEGGDVLSMCTAVAP